MSLVSVLMQVDYDGVQHPVEMDKETGRKSCFLAGLVSEGQVLVEQRSLSLRPRSAFPLVNDNAKL